MRTADWLALQIQREGERRAEATPKEADIISEEWNAAAEFVRNIDTTGFRPSED